MDLPPAHKRQTKWICNKGISTRELKEGAPGGLLPGWTFRDFLALRVAAILASLGRAPADWRGLVARAQLCRGPDAADVMEAYALDPWAYAECRGRGAPPQELEASVRAEQARLGLAAPFPEGLPSIIEAMPAVLEDLRVFAVATRVPIGRREVEYVAGRLTGEIPAPPADRLSELADLCEVAYHVEEVFRCGLLVAPWPLLW